MTIYGTLKKGIVTESIRMLCANLDMMRKVPKGEALTVAVSSFSVDSGKTFMAVNASMCLADGGKKVVLLDLDLRKRSLSRHLGIAHKTR